MTDVVEHPTAVLARRTAGQSAVAAVLVGVGAEAVGMLSGWLARELVFARCGDCGEAIFAYVIFFVTPAAWLGTAAGAGLVAALLARRDGRPAVRPGLLVAAGTAIVLAAAVALLPVMPRGDEVLFAMPFVAGFLGYLMAIWWSNRRQPDTLP